VVKKKEEKKKKEKSQRQKPCEIFKGGLGTGGWGLRGLKNRVQKGGGNRERGGGGCNQKGETWRDQNSMKRPMK